MNAKGRTADLINRDPKLKQELLGRIGRVLRSTLGSAREMFRHSRRARPSAAIVTIYANHVANYFPVQK